MSNNLTGTFIANTYQNLLQKPDLSKEEYYNGLGQTVSVINRDAIGTIKMFYPVGGSISTYFDVVSGLGIAGTEWEGWALCDGRNGGPDLRGRFVAAAVIGYGPIGTNVEVLKAFSPAWTTMGATGGNTFGVMLEENLPPHNHQFRYHRRTQIGSAGSTDLVDSINDTPGIPDPTEEGNSGVASTNNGKGESSSYYPPYTILAFVIRCS